MKRVEDASEAAAAAAFGLHKTSRKGHAVKLTSVEQLRDHNDTYDEAQELVNEWMSSKGELGFEDNLEDEIWSEDYHRNSKLDSDLSIDRIVQEATGFGLNGEYPAPNPALMDLDSYDEHAAAEDILKTMLQKEVVRPEVLADLGLDTGQATNGRLKQRNPIVKMELRQQQVKENRERRQKEAEKRRLEIKSKRESLFVAKQLQLKEEKEKITQAKREEAEIQQEMARIRKELAEERRNREDSRKKQQQVYADGSPRTPKTAPVQPAFSARDDGERQGSPRSEAPLAPPPRSATHEQPGSHAGGSKVTGGRWAEHSKEARKRLHRERVKVQQARNNLRCLHVHFGAWYDVVVERRAQLGRALAIADWKRLLRAWNGWRTAVRHSRMDREQLEHEMQLKDLYRKQQAADRFFQSGLLRKYFIEWQLWVLRQQEERNLEEVQHSFRNKMASFLEAASQNCAPLLAPSDLQSGGSASGAGSGGGKVERDVLKSAASAREGRAPAATPRAWPLTRRYEQFMAGTTQGHIGQPAASAAPAADGAAALLVPATSRRPVAREASKKADVPSQGSDDSAVPDADVAVPRTFASRFAAQQRALQEQRRQLQEQQRLIAELKFEHDRRALEEQAQQSRLLGEQLQVLAQQLLASRTTATAAVAGAALPVPAAAAAGSRAAAGGTARTEGDSAAVEPPALEPLTARSAASSSAATSATNASAAAPSHSRFVEAMNERASARARAKAEREERRRKAENEKLLQMKAEEEERQRKEEEEKKQQQLLVQERRRLEAQRKAEKQQQAEQLVKLNSVAAEHSTLRLLRHYAWRPWRSMMASVHESMSRAAAHHSTKLLRTCLLDWLNAVKEMVDEREHAATALYHRHLLAQSFSNWKKWRMQAAIMDQKADRFYARVTRQRVLKAWLDYVTTEKIETWEKERLAAEHCKLRLVRFAFYVWKELPVASRKEKERAKRREDMRRKVALLLPDFEGMALTSSQESQGM